MDDPFRHATLRLRDLLHNKMNNGKSQLIHFIGIGGIGVSALAKHYISQGARVSGSDLASSEITEELARLGAEIKIGKHKKSNVPKDSGKIIYTAAVSRENPEFKYARSNRLKLQSYPEAVGELTKKYSTITVSGSHGKSTTTALSALVLEEGHFDPTVIIGTKVKEFGNSNFRRGMGSHLLLEADEWNKSFLNYSPKIAVVTNVDAEHLDTYKNVENVEKTFKKYLEKVPRDGVIVANADDTRLKKIAEQFGKRVCWYSLASPEAGLVRKILKVPGEHNVSNALAALTLGRTIGIHEPNIMKALARFSGTWRRFDFQGIVNGAFIFSDYGHHPREIQATISAARQRFPLRRIWCVYQPHQYQRLSYLWDDFVGAFDGADCVCLLPVYDVAGRETKKAKTAVNSLKLSRELIARGKNSHHSANFEDAKEYICMHVRPRDVVLIMGAGDIYNLTKQII